MKVLAENIDLMMYNHVKDEMFMVSPPFILQRKHKFCGIVDMVKALNLNVQSIP